MKKRGQEQDEAAVQSKRRLRLREAKHLQLDELLRMAASLHWYALHVDAQKEFVAQLILERKRLATYVPARHEWRRRNKYSTKKELRTYAVAPRYVFAGFPPGVPLWFELFRLPLVRSAVGINGTPKRIPPQAMQALLRKTGGGIQAPAAHRFMKTHHEFAVGDQAQVVGGPFDGMKVPVKEIVGDRAKLTLELFGGVVDEIDLPLEMLVAAE